MTKLYFNLNEYQNEIDSFYQKLSNSSKEGAFDILKDLFLFILKNYEDGIIGSKKLAYDIAGTMQFEVTKSGKLKELTEEAGELELPDHHISGNPQNRLQELITLIKSL